MVFAAFFLCVQPKNESAAVALFSSVLFVVRQPASVEHAFLARYTSLHTRLLISIERTHTNHCVIPYFVVSWESQCGVIFRYRGRSRDTQTISCFSFHLCVLPLRSILLAPKLSIPSE